MKCPNCGEPAEEVFVNDGIEIQKDYTKVLMSAHCYKCWADIELEYTCTVCEIDKEV